MNWIHWSVIAALVAAWPCAAQTDEDRRRISEFQDRIRNGQPNSPDDQAYLKTFNERMRVDFPKQHPARESTGLIPLPDLGKGAYQGEQGGLYPGGENAPPVAHAKAGVKLAKSIRPLDAEGREADDGKIVMISIGMSNTTMESQFFGKLVHEASGVNPKYLWVDCAQGGQVGIVTANPRSGYWKVANDRLWAAGVTPKQVQVAWVKQATAAPMRGFPMEARKLQGDLAGTVRNLRDKYPNIKIVYLSSRIYAGYAVVPLNPEPYSYEGGFSVKWLIADQISGNPELNYDPAKGPVKAPWLAWGPYLWTDGVKGRNDGLTWGPADVVKDGTHPSPSGSDKVAKLLLDFLKTDSTARPWFLGH